MENKELVLDSKQLDQAISLTSTDVQAVSDRLTKLDLMGSAIKKALIANDDYGVIPGTKKPCLLQPGARKIVQLFGLSTEFQELPPMTINNQTIIKVKCILSLGDRVISESYGTDLVGNKQNIGWETNKAFKMAQKRAMVGAVLQVSNLSKIFTQDMEDFDRSKQGVSREQVNEVYRLLRELSPGLNFNTVRGVLMEQFNNWLSETKLEKSNLYELEVQELEDFKDWLKKQYTHNTEEVEF